MFTNPFLTVDINILDDNFQLRLCLRVSQQHQDDPDHVDPNSDLFLSVIPNSELVLPWNAFFNT